MEKLGQAVTMLFTELRSHFEHVDASNVQGLSTRVSGHTREIEGHFTTNADTVGTLFAVSKAAIELERDFREERRVRALAAVDAFEEAVAKAPRSAYSDAMGR